MRHILAVAVVLCGAGWAGAPALGQGTFTLEFTEATPQAVPALQAATHTCVHVATKPDAVTKIPDGLPAQVTYFRFGPADAPTWILAVAGEKPTLYADADRSGDLSKATPLIGKSDQSGTWFEPLTLTAKDGGKARVRLMSHSSKARVRLMSHSGAGQQVLGCLHAMPAGCRMGKAKLGDKTYSIALIDGNLNGRYDDRLAALRRPEEMDAVAVDLNGDGRFDLSDPGRPAPEWAPLARGLAVDGKYYKINAAPDGSQIEITPTELEYGQLDFGPLEAQIAAFSDWGFQRIETKGGKVKAAAGRYSTISGEVRRSDGKAVWRLQFASDPGEVGTFVLHGGETLKLPLGGPLVPTVDVTVANGTAQFNYRLVGRAGEEYSPTVQKGNEPVPPPKLEVVDPAGKVIYSASFEYG